MNRKHIVCYGDSNTWGYCAATGGRYADDARWTRLLQEQLGEGWLVAEEGVCGRTTVFEDPLTEGLCGFTHLAPALYANSPLDLLVVMLGTNDCKQRYSATAQNIADGLARLVTRAKQLPVWAGEPKVLIVAPIMIDPRVHQVPRVGQEMGEGCVEKSRLLPGLMERTARETGCEFIDATPMCSRVKRTGCTSTRTARPALRWRWRQRSGCFWAAGAEPRHRHFGRPYPCKKGIWGVVLCCMRSR